MNEALALLKRYVGIIKYIISGGLAAVVNLATLAALTEYAHLHYLTSAVLSFVVAFFVSFLLQKFWTFQNTERGDMHLQMIAYLTVSVVNLGINTLLIYLLVEVAHLWYLLAALVAGAIIALWSFFIYRRVIFASGESSNKVRLVFSYVERHAHTLLVVVAMLVTLFFATYKLTESPPTWLDEGIISQVAMNMVQGHTWHTVLQPAPGEYVSAGYVSTSYPVTYPVALSFELFGAGLLQARIVMVLFIMLFVSAAYALLRRLCTPWQAVAGVTLIATFAPLYGNGKNVLGEVPGLFFLTCFLLCVRRIELGNARLRAYAGAGILLGLTVVTKPIFLLLLPVVGAVLLGSRSRYTLLGLATAFASFLAPLAVWVTTQFGNESVGQMLAIYVNPHGNDLASSVWHNALSFFTQPQPAYAALLLGIWLLSLLVRIIRKETITRVEYIAAGFALLVYGAYLRGAEYYRYFFLGEVFALLYLPKALEVLWHKKMPQWVMTGVFVVLIGFQFYQCLFSSWVADHYASHRSQDIHELTKSLDAGSLLIYQAPEVVPFLHTASYYQYLTMPHVVTVGEENKKLLSKGAFDAVFISSEYEAEVDLSHYVLVQTIDRYSLWHKNKK